MAPRSIWNGAIAFGLVQVPIKVYSATESKTVHFHEVHLKDSSRIEHRRICPREDKEVPYDEIVKGFEVKQGEWVELTDDEIAAAAGPRSDAGSSMTASARSRSASTAVRSRCTRCATPATSSTRRTSTSRA